MNELELNTLTWMNIVDIMRSKTDISWEYTNMHPFPLNLKCVKLNICYKNTNKCESCRDFHDNDTLLI